MANSDYNNYILSTNDRILIDTSSLMDYTSLSLLVNDIKSALINSNKKIIIPKVVWMELMRHRQSSNEDKKNKVNHAIEIIENNLDVFYLDTQDMNNEDIFSAFADAELLSQLIKHKPDHKQLLITNDKKLSSDAFKLNKQESCYGGYISVCYITNEGHLNKSKIISETHEQKTIIKEVIKEVPAEVSVTEVEKSNDSKYNWIIFGASISTFGLGCLVGKYGNRILTTFSKTF